MVDVSILGLASVLWGFIDSKNTPNTSEQVKVRKLQTKIFKSGHVKGDPDYDIGSVDHFGYLWPQKMPEVGNLWLQK